MANSYEYLLEQKKVFAWEKSNFHRTGLGHQHGRRFIVLGHQNGRRDVVWKRSRNLGKSLLWLLYIVLTIFFLIG